MDREEPELLFGATHPARTRQRTARSEGYLAEELVLGREYDCDPAGPLSRRSPLDGLFGDHRAGRKKIRPDFAVDGGPVSFLQQHRPSG